jgi:hypothetical protein
MTPARAAMPLSVLVSVPVLAMTLPANPLSANLARIVPGSIPPNPITASALRPYLSSQLTIARNIITVSRGVIRFTFSPEPVEIRIASGESPA